jgi:hypothetical protein
MSGYPDANYAPPDTYPSDIGTSCSRPKPRWFYDGATFCSDVNINTSLTVAGLTTTAELIVAGIQFKPTVIQAFNGTFTVLAA